MNTTPTESAFCVVAAVNNREILHACLERSPDIASGRVSLSIYEDFPSAAKALNTGLDNSVAPIVIFAHQDVYLPARWLDRLSLQIRQIEQRTPDWSAIGLFGRMINGEHVGRVWSSGMGRELGAGGFAPAEAVTLDELVIILRRASGLRFDEALPGFHLYGTDIVLEGNARGQKAFVVDAPVVHNSKPVRTLRGAYANAYRFMQKKWWSTLPKRTLICDITRGPMTLWRAQFGRYRVRLRGLNCPAFDAVEIARQLRYE